MINEQASALSLTDDDGPSCQHHWVIQEADGPISLGLCRECGAFKEFKNYLEASHWGDEKARNESRVSLLGTPSRSRPILEEDDEF